MKLTDNSEHRPETAARGVAFLSASYVLVVLMGYAVHVVATRTLDKPDYGRFVVLLSLITWIKACEGSLLTQGPAKIVSEDPGRLRAVLSSLSRWSWVVAGAIAVALAVASGAIASLFNDPGMTPLLRVSSVYMFIFCGFILGRNLLAALRLYVRASVLMATHSVVRALAACTPMLLGLGVIGAVWGLVAGLMVASAVSLVSLLQACVRIEPKPYSDVLRRSIVWGAMGLPTKLGVVTLISMDLWLLKSLIGDQDMAGLYGSAVTMSRLPNFVLLGLSGAVFARVSGALAQDNRSLARSVSVEAMRFLLVVFVLICAVTAGAASEIMTLLFTGAYASAGGMLTLLMMAMSCGAFLILSMELIAAANRPGSRLALVLTLLPVGAVLNFFLIRNFGAFGAAFGSLLTLALGALVGCILVKRFLDVAPPLLTILRCVAAGAIVFAIGSVWPAQGILLLLKLTSLTILYAAVLFVLRELTREDVFTVWRAVKGRD